MSGHEEDWRLADRFALQQSWWLASELVRRHPHLLVSRIENEEGVPLVFAHDGPTGVRVQFDLTGGLTFLSGKDIHRVPWLDVMAQQHPRALIERIEESTGLGVPPASPATTNRALVYRLVARLLALNVDDTQTWQAVTAEVPLCNADIEDCLTALSLFPAAQEAAMAYFESDVAQAHAVAKRSGSPTYYHQPLWLILRDMEPVAVLDEAGIAHLTSERVVRLMHEYDRVGRDINALVAFLIADSQTFSILAREGVSPAESGDGRAVLAGQSAGRRDPAELLVGSKKQHQAPAVWESKVRGLMLGITLGDSLGAIDGAIPSTGPLAAGVATQLAAWTADGLLRRATRYGMYDITGSGQGLNDHFGHAHYRWLAHRDPSIGTPKWVTEYPGWLSVVPVMMDYRGKSPSIESAIRTGRVSGADSCRPAIKALPIAAYAGAERFSHTSPEQTAAFACGVTALTHRHPHTVSATAAAVTIAVCCLREGNSFREAVMVALRHLHDPQVEKLIGHAIGLADGRPRDSLCLHHIAPDDSSHSVLAGAIYTAMSFPTWESANEAIAFARLAPDGDGVAAMVGAFLGAIHGYEVFPTSAISRLDLGWVMDRLAIDLALEVKDDQVPQGGWKDGGEPWLEPWWDAKYPGM